MQGKGSGCSLASASRGRYLWTEGKAGAETAGMMTSYAERPG